MRAVLSDVHGNHAALARAFDEIAADGVGSIYCLGDLGPSAEAIALVEARCALVLPGNHDVLDLAFDRVGIGREFLERICGGDPVRIEADAVYVHGSPRLPLVEYLHPESARDYLLDMDPAGPRLVFCGHTHVACLAGEASVLAGLDLEGRWHDVSIGRWIVNVGSIGCPEDGLGPCYALHDEIRGAVAFRRLG